MRKIISLYLLSLFCQLTWGQDLVVSGSVLDQANEPIPGVTVRLGNSRTGTVTDAAGFYTIHASQNAELIFSYIGMKETRVKVTGPTLNVTMNAEDYALDEVVVVAFGTQRRSDLASSVASLKNVRMGQQPVFSLEQAMQGKMPGVKMNVSTGVPGGNVVTRIRGASSFSAGNNPLYVVDGIPMNDYTDSFTNYGHETLSAIADLNPSDIASVEVLKDASASALYGSRASNGVILITTKKGEYNQNKIQFDTYYGVQSFVKKVGFTNAHDWLQIQNEARTHYNADNNLSDGDKLFQKPLGDPNNPMADVDWMDEITRSNGVIQNYQLSFSGGNNRTRSYISGGYFNQKGLVKMNDYEKYTFRINLDHQIAPVLKIGTDLTMTYMTTNRIHGSNNIYSPWSNALTQRPDEPVYNPDGSYYSTNQYNPIQTLNETEYNTRKMRMIGGVFAELKIWRGLQFKTRFGTDLSYLVEQTYENSKSLQGASSNGSALDGRSWMSQLIVENMFTYDHKLDYMTMNFLLGQSYQENSTDYNSLTKKNFPSDDLKYLSSASVLNSGTSGWSANALLSYFARARFLFKDRYIVEASVRRDGSSKFADDNRYGVFPSGALGWIIDKESFFPENDIVNGLKLRTSYGLTGNQGGISDFVSRSQLAASAAYNDLPGFAVTAKANKDLKWEKTRQFDVGVDMHFLKSRITASFDYYSKKTIDLLMSRSLPSTSGFSTMTDNIGSVRNEGIEFSFMSRNITGKDFTWTTNFNITHEWNKILALNKTPEGDWIDEASGWYQIRSVGKPIGAYYLIKSDGVYQNKEEIPSGLWDQGVRPGDMRYEDYNKDGMINSNDRQIIQAPEPKFYGGFDNYFTYKNFDLSVSTYFSYGGKLLSMWAAEEGGANLGYSLGAITQKTADNRWMGEGTSNKTPRAVYGTQGKWNTQMSDRFFEDASFLKIKDITLGYTLPRELTRKAYIQNLRVYLKGENLWTITRYSGFDPEVMSAASMVTGADQGTQPQPRSFLFGLSITL